MLFPIIMQKPKYNITILIKTGFNKNQNYYNNSGLYNRG